MLTSTTDNQRAIDIFYKLHILLSLTLLQILPNPVFAVTFKVDEENRKFASAILIEAETGAALFEYNADVRRSPASTQKILLQLVVMDAIAEEKYALTDSVHTSAWASRMGGSQVFLKQGEVFPLSEMMRAIAIASANDACVAVAEHIGGSVDGFVELMNSRVSALGLNSTQCVNVHGLDDTPSAEGNFTSARDLTQIARALLAYQQILDWSSVRIGPFRDGEFTLYNTNRLLGKFHNLDGLKTGYTVRAGYCLVATAQRRGMRLISVIMGSPAERIRDRETARLLSWGFNHFSKAAVVKPGEQIGDVALEWGVDPKVSAVTADTVMAVLTTAQRHQLDRQIELPAEHPAPIEAGQKLGQLKISLGDSLLATVDLVADRSVEKMNLWQMFLSYF